MREPTQEEMERWVRQWREAGQALKEQRCRELAGLRNDRAYEATETLLELAEDAYVIPSRRESSGLVEQQALFRKLRDS